jgi:predicted  nucleic acid-binding Zn ribbon protein
VVTVSDSSLTQSSIPVNRDINENGGRIFIECCLNAKVIVYRNGDIYATRENTTDSVIEVFNPDIQLQIGDTINAKQICPNQTISELSATRTITSVCSPINGGSINGLDIVSKGSVIMYSIVNLTGERPYEYLAEVSGGTIIA